MSITGNIVNQISTNGLAGVTKPQGFNLDDNTFEKLLQGLKANEIDTNDSLKCLGNMGQPAGLVIEPFEEVSATNTTPVTPVNSEPIEIKEVDTGSNYFSNLLKEAPQEHKSIMNAAKKYAASVYNTIGKSLVEDLNDFAEDIKSLS